MILAVDGDILLYRCAAVCEDDFDRACDEILDKMLLNIAQDTGIEDMRIYISSEGPGYRHSVAVTKPYKGNRDTKRKPKHLRYCADYLRRVYNAITVQWYEADDAIASDMVQNGAAHCGIDKDILQVAGRHYDFVNKEWKEVTQEQATINLFRQILTGDKVDNIQGLPRVAEKTAEKIITDAETAVVNAKAHYTEVCGKLLPEVDVATYWKEQVLLVQLLTDLNVMDLITAKVEAKGLNI